MKAFISLYVVEFVKIHAIDLSTEWEKRSGIEGMKKIKTTLCFCNIILELFELILERDCIYTYMLIDLCPYIMKHFTTLDCICGVFMS